MRTIIPVLNICTHGIFVSMESADLTREQVDALQEQIRPMVGYLGRLIRRMERRHFAPTDPPYISTTAAYKALHGLSVDVHYLGCRESTGGPRGKPVQSKDVRPNDSSLETESHRRAVRGRVAE